MEEKIIDMIFAGKDQEYISKYIRNGQFSKEEEKRLNMKYMAWHSEYLMAKQVKAELLQRIIFSIILVIIGVTILVMFTLQKGLYFLTSIGFISSGSFYAIKSYNHFRKPLEEHLRPGSEVKRSRRFHKWK